MDVVDRNDLPFPQSLPEFQGLFPDDRACAAYLEKARWGAGFTCPHCQVDVLAGAQLTGGVIGARTEIAARSQASNCHAITGFRNGIADPEFREKRLAAEIFKTEGLLAAELAAQAALPIHRRKIGGCMGARELGFLVRLGCGIQVSALGFHRHAFRLA